jgi:hypothetical protein
LQLQFGEDRKHKIDLMVVYSRAFEAPTYPATLFAINTTATGTELTWTQSTDNVGVLGYRIYNGSVQNRIFIN